MIFVINLVIHMDWNYQKYSVYQDFVTLYNGNIVWTYQFDINKFKMINQLCRIDCMMDCEIETTT